MRSIKITSNYLGKTMQINEIKSSFPLFLHFKIQEQKVIKTIQKNIHRLIEAEKKALEEEKRYFNKWTVCTLYTR
jgi:hypothetical protein